MNNRQALTNLNETDRMTYHLLKKGKTQTEVASLMDVTRQAISLRVKSMVERGVALHRQDQTKGPKKAWSAQEEARLIELYNEGVPSSAVAQEMGRGESSVRVRLTLLSRKGRVALKSIGRPWSMQEDLRLMALYKEGTPVPAIAEELSRTLTAVYHRASILRKEHVVERLRVKTIDRQRIMGLRRQGLSNGLIAKAMGLTKNTVSYVLYRLRKEGVEVPPSRFFLANRKE